MITSLLDNVLDRTVIAGFTNVGWLSGWHDAFVPTAPTSIPQGES